MHPLIASIRRSLQDICPAEEQKALSMYICCDIMGIDAVDIYMGKDIILSQTQQQQLANILHRLQHNEPIQYIRGFADFCGYSFRVGPGVLVPRPETAELVGVVLQENPDARHILDIGTGSGCIAISLSKALPHAAVSAWDLSDKALGFARWNNVHLGANVEFEQRDVFSSYEGSSVYDVLVSNPPYIKRSEQQDMSPQVWAWEPDMALFVSDDDPLLFYRRIAVLGKQLLESGGRLYFEINRMYGADVAQLLELNHYHHVRVIKDIFKNERIVTAIR